ncbi:hypothetical protein KJ785_01805 [Patescibacteria group bacterium]|nr:hypothetical protein [Patescibacteria group bacterium]
MRNARLVIKPENENLEQWRAGISQFLLAYPIIIFTFYKSDLEYLSLFNPTSKPLSARHPPGGCGACSEV